MDRDDLNTLFKNLEPSDAQIDRIRNKINHCDEKHGLRFKSVLIFGIVVGLLFITTAFATDFFGLSKSTLEYLEPKDEEQEQYLSMGAQIINQKIESESGTLYFKEVMGDSNSTYVFFDFIAPEGTIIDSKQFVFDDMRMTIGPENKASFMKCITLDDKDKDNIVPLLARITSEEALQNLNIKLWFKNLKGYDNEKTDGIYQIFYYPDTGNSFEYYRMLKINDDNILEDDYYVSVYDSDGLIESNDVSKFNTEYTSEYDGEWSIEFKASFNPYSHEQKVNQVISIEGYEAEVESFTISPISSTFKIKSYYIPEINEKLGSKRISHLFKYTIYYKDGTFEKIEDGFVGRIGPIDGKNTLGKITGGAYFNKVIDVSNIDYIEYFGEKIYIN